MKNEKKPTKVDIERDFEFSSIDTLDELINHFQLLKDNYSRRVDIVDQTVEFNYGPDDEEPYLTIYTRRLETKDERRIRNQIEHQITDRKKTEDLDNLKDLMDKYPKEVFKWMSSPKRFKPCTSVKIALPDDEDDNEITKGFCFSRKK